MTKSTRSRAAAWYRRLVCGAVLAAAQLIFLAMPAVAQISSGTIVGSIADSSGMSVPAASVSLIHTATGRERRVETGIAGDFVFNGLEPGEYKLEVTKTGFKTLQKPNIVLPAGLRLVLGVLALDLGTTVEVVSVVADAAIVKTQSSERTDMVSNAQVDRIVNLGRNIPSLVGLLPGVVVTGDEPVLGRRTFFSASGNRRTANSVTVDGIMSNDIDNGADLKLGISQDAVSEVRIILGNPTAEYGRTGGASVEMITRSGTRQFHGLGSYFRRHEQFNANEFFNNRNGIAKPRYRYHTWTYNLGGPIYWPGKFNSARSKLFFFWNQEFWPNRSSQTGTVTVPTALERAGDFSQTVDLNGRLIVVTDPANRSPFPGNRIPANRIDPNGQALLRFFPEPNLLDRSISRGNYNYVFATERNRPTRTETLKLDYNIDAYNFLAGTFNSFSETDEGYLVFGSNWEQNYKSFRARTKGGAIRYTHVFSPAVIDESHLGYFTNPETLTSLDEQLRRNQRDSVGFKAGQLNPAANPLNLIPFATFAGVPNFAQLTFGFAGSGVSPESAPIVAPNVLLSYTNKLTAVHGTHTMKAGVYLERAWRGRYQGTPNGGSYDFGVNANNPLNSGHAYSNAVLGVFNSYTEASGVPHQRARLNRYEFFAQDNWRIHPRLTLDYGLRLHWLIPLYDAQDAMAGFVASRFDPSRQAQLIQPGFDPQGRRVGVHPVTRQLFPVTQIGAIAPGVGDPFNGMVVDRQDSALPRGLVRNRGMHWGPRLGFAYDPFGRGKTAVRGGFGMYYTPLNTTRYLALAGQPPLLVTPVVSFGQISTLLSSSGVLFPTNVRGLDETGHIPTTMNFSFSVQQNVGFATVVDVAYLGNLGRHLTWNRPLNAIPFGSNFDARNADPTQAGRPLPPAFLRPRSGFNNIDLLEWASSSNYHSLQVTATRRFTRGLQFGAAWTWSKAMDYNSEDSNTISALVPVRVWNYGLSTFDRTQVLKINWLWEVPKVGWKSAPARLALNDWQLSGIASFIGGEPLDVGLSTTTGFDITGSPTDLPRPDVIGNPVLPKGERTFSRNFRTDVFRLPARGTPGNAARTVIRGPGVNNWDVALFKDFPMREPVRLQFRWEMYNVLNHTQFSGLDRTARFDPAGNQVNSRLGEFITARDARRMQFALRFSF